MTKANQRRLVLYPAALVVAVGLSVLVLQSKARERRALIGTLQNGGELMAELGLHDKAEANARRILEMDPDNVYARLLLACCYQRTARFDDSIREYRKALKSTRIPEQRQYLQLVLADVHRLKKDYAGARERLDRYRASYGDHARAQMVEGQLYADLGDHSRAASCFRKAAGAKPPAKGSRLALARAYLELGDKPRALEALEAVVSGERRTHGVWYAIAELRRDLGDREGARGALRSALADEPIATRRRLQKEEDAWGPLARGLQPDRKDTEG
jgi:Tfp pilus assembly protein PilF